MPVTLRGPLPDFDAIGEFDAGRKPLAELGSFALDRCLRSLLGIAGLRLGDFNLLLVVFHLLRRHEPRPPLVAEIIDSSFGSTKILRSGSESALSDTSVRTKEYTLPLAVIRLRLVREPAFAGFTYAKFWLPLMIQNSLSPQV